MMVTKVNIKNHRTSADSETNIQILNVGFRVRVKARDFAHETADFLEKLQEFLDEYNSTKQEDIFAEDWEVVE